MGNPSLKLSKVLTIITFCAQKNHQIRWKVTYKIVEAV